MTFVEDSAPHSWGKRSIRSIFIGLLALVTMWSAAAIWFDAPAPRWLAAALAVLPPLAVLCSLLWLHGSWLTFALMAPGVVLLWWSNIPPSNNRDWLPEVARLAVADFDGEQVTIRNVRNFDYRSETDFTERWEERTYRLDQVVGIDMYLSTWGSPWIAHTIVSWEFTDGRYLAISIETRKERGEEYSPVLGFFRQYELYYVVADERDVVRLRTNFRGENVLLYRLTARPSMARALLVDYLAEVNRLNAKPRWYNAMTHNCTTTIRLHAQHVAAGNPWDWRLLVNGRLDELGYERGTIDTSIPFTELRRRSDITQMARASGVDSDFSTRIRRRLPPRVAASD